jgi:hypothetical protein
MLQGGLVGADVQIVDVHGTPTVRASDQDFAVEGDEGRRKILRRVRIGEVPTDRPHVPDEGVGDHPLRVCQEHVPLPYDGRIEHLAVPD